MCQSIIVFEMKTIKQEKTVLGEGLVIYRFWKRVGLKPDIVLLRYSPSDRKTLQKEKYNEETMRTERKNDKKNK